MLGVDVGVTGVEALVVAEVRAAGLPPEHAAVSPMSSTATPATAALR